jgi:UDP-2,4-diacetamido-2,4,6-trideoxy-beta-L-altropyranose hydrolase
MGLMVVLQRATFEDCKLVYNWRNELASRKGSLSSSPISWEDHQEWFNKRLHLSHNETIWMALSVCELETEPVGYGRILLEDNDVGVVSVTVGPSFRGHGIGKAIVTLLRDKIWAMDRVAIARVKTDNDVSLGLFGSVGFVLDNSSFIGSIRRNGYVVLKASP